SGVSERRTPPVSGRPDWEVIPVIAALALSVSLSMLGSLVGRSDALWAPPGTFYGAERSPGPQPGTRDTRGDRCGAVRIAAVGPGADLRARRLAPGEAWAPPREGPLRRGTLAQWVEQRTFNPRVVGSSPTGPTDWPAGLPGPVTPTSLPPGRLVTMWSRERAGNPAVTRSKALRPTPGSRCP